MGFGSGVALHSKRAHDVRVSALSEKPRDACSKDKGRTAEVRSQESEVKSQELEQEHVHEKIFAMS